MIGQSHRARTPSRRREIRNTIWTFVLGTLLAAAFGAHNAAADIIPDGNRGVRRPLIVDAIDNPTHLALFTYAIPEQHAAPVLVGKSLDLGNGSRFNFVLIVGIPRSRWGLGSPRPDPAWFGQRESYTSLRVALPEGVVVSGRLPSRDTIYVPTSSTVTSAVTHVLVAVLHDTGGRPTGIQVVHLDRDGARDPANARADDPIELITDATLASHSPPPANAHEATASQPVATLTWSGISGIAMGALIALAVGRRRSRAAVRQP